MDTGGVEAHPFGRVIVAIAPLPQSFAGAPDALTLDGPHAAEARGPRVGAARANLDNRYKGSLASNEVELEVADAQIRRDDFVSARAQIFTDGSLSGGSVLAALSARDA